MRTLPPWDALLKQMVWRQLDDWRGMRILDFGSGGGDTAAHLSQWNDVIAVEPSAEMLADRAEGAYEQLCGGIELVAAMPDASFDGVICHNVLESVPDRAAVLRELTRVLRPGGRMSVVKHNRAGRVFQMAVLLDDQRKAHTLLDGLDGASSQFGTIHYYEDEDVTAACPPLRLEKTLGLRTFWDLQQRQEKHPDPAWQQEMLRLEARVSEMPEYCAVAFFHHLLLRNNPAAMREHIFRRAMDMYGVAPDYPWAKTPESAVLRHPHHRKWFALVMPVTRRALGLPGEGVIDVMNVKCDPLLTVSLRQQPGFRPAYHMNKEKWLTILLDGSVPPEKIDGLLALSYDLTC